MQQFTFGLVEFDSTKQSYFVQEVEDFEPIKVDENETFEDVINATNWFESMVGGWFNATDHRYWIDDTMLENGRLHIYRLRNDATIDFETEDIRDRIELPAGVCGDEARFIIFTNGDSENDVFQWGIFYPLP